MAALRIAALLPFVLACAAERPAPPVVPRQDGLRSILTASNDPSCRTMSAAESHAVEEARKPVHYAGYLIATNCEYPLTLPLGSAR
jgi:hypothetical protein